MRYSPAVRLFGKNGARARATGRLHRACRTFGCPSPADQRAEIHQCLIELPRRAPSHGLQCRGKLSNPAIGRRAVAPAWTKDPAEDARNVGVDGGARALVCKRCHRTGGIGAHARKPLECGWVVGYFPVVFRHHGSRERVQVLGAAIIAEAVPRFSHRFRTRLCQGVHRGVPIEELVVILLDPADLSLLQHELGNEDAVGIPRSSPRQVPSLPAKPREESALESESVGREFRSHRCGR